MRSILPVLAVIDSYSPESWRPYFTGRIEVQEIECKHSDGALPVHIETIGRLLESYLRGID
jgi:thioesterase domain-containing protein